MPHLCPRSASSYHSLAPIAPRRCRCASGRPTSPKQPRRSLTPEVKQALSVVGGTWAIDQHSNPFRNTMIVEAQVTINGSMLALWTALIDIENAAEIISGIEKIEV